MLAKIIITMKLRSCFISLKAVSVIIQEDGIRKEMELNADMYLHPANLPFFRSEGSIGLVIERKRAAQGYVDGLLWSVITVTINYMSILNSTISKRFLASF
jgi:hypothetical protein